MRNVKQNAIKVTLEAKINDLSCSIKDSDAASPAETDKDLMDSRMQTSRYPDFEYFKY